MSDTDKKELRGLVAQVLNVRELVINIGSGAGVGTGMRFAVMAPKGHDIVDPATKQVLDTVQLEKTRVEVVEVRSRIAICRTYRKTASRSLYFDLLAQQSPEYETLKLRTGTNFPELPPEQSYVKVGDPVVLLGEKA